MNDTYVNFTILSLCADPLWQKLTDDAIKDTSYNIANVTSINSIVENFKLAYPIGLLLLDVRKLNGAAAKDLQTLKEYINAGEIPVILLATNDNEVPQLLEKYTYGLVDVILLSSGHELLKCKIDIFHKLHICTGSIAGAIEEKKNISNQFQRFIQIVAHDLKSPLSSSVFLLSFLKGDSRITASDDLKEYVQKVYESNVNISDMINLIAEYSRESVKDQEIELVDTKEIVLEVIRSVDTHNYFNTEGSFPVINTKKRKLHHVLDILLQVMTGQKHQKNEHVTLGVNDKGPFYEFYLKYNRSFIMPELNKTFLISDTYHKTNDHNSNIHLNSLKLLVEEQSGKISIRKLSDDQNEISFQWMK